MNKETIEKAAKEAIRDYYQCNDEYPCEGRDYCEFCNGHNSAFDCNESCGAEEFNDGFIEGAQWRINAVWHGLDELPEPDVTVIVEYAIDGHTEYVFTHLSENANVVTDKYGFCFYVDGVEITRWAYIDDLLPDGKEV